MNLDEVPQKAMILVVVAALFVAGFLVISGLQTTGTSCASGTYNESANICQNSTGGSLYAAKSFAGNSSDYLASSMNNVVKYAPTWGIIIGVSVILGIIIVGFMFGKNKGWI